MPGLAKTLSVARSLATQFPPTRPAVNHQTLIVIASSLHFMIGIFTFLTFTGSGDSNGNLYKGSEDEIDSSKKEIDLLTRANNQKWDDLRQTFEVNTVSLNTCEIPD